MTEGVNFMPKIIYNKLVRDGIIDIVKRSGKMANAKVLSDAEFAVELSKKLQEEVNEFLESKNIEELADILEVIEYLAISKGATLEHILNIKQQKKADRGGFNNKIFLESVEDN